MFAREREQSRELNRKKRGFYWEKQQNTEQDKATAAIFWIWLYTKLLKTTKYESFKN